MPFIKRKKTYKKLANHQRLGQALGSEYGTSADLSIWLEYFAESVVKSLAELKPALLKVRGAFVDSHNVGAEVGLSTDQAEVIVFAEVNGSISTVDYLRATKLPRSTVIKRFNDLVRLGFLQIEGNQNDIFSSK